MRESLSNALVIRKSVPAAKLTLRSSLPAVWAGLKLGSCGEDANLVLLKTELSLRAVQRARGEQLLWQRINEWEGKNTLSLFQREKNLSCRGPCCMRSCRAACQAVLCRAGSRWGRLSWLQARKDGKPHTFVCQGTSDVRQAFSPGGKGTARGSSASRAAAEGC